MFKGTLGLSKLHFNILQCVYLQVREGQSFSEFPNPSFQPRDMPFEGLSVGLHLSGEMHSTGPMLRIGMLLKHTTGETIGQETSMRHCCSA